MGTIGTACRGNDKAAYMLGQMARIAIQEGGQCNQLLDNRAVGIEAVFGQALADFRAVVPPGKRAGQPPDAFEIQAEGLADILDRRTGAVGDDRCSNGGTVLAIFLIDILDDFFPALMLEIDIDIGGLVTLPGNKPLKQQIAARRINLGDAQAIAHCGIGCRAASLAKNAARAGMPYDIEYRQEIGLIVELRDQVQFVLDLFLTLTEMPSGKRLVMPSSTMRRR